METANSERGGGQLHGDSHGQERLLRPPELRRARRGGAARPPPHRDHLQRPHALRTPLRELRRPVHHIVEKPPCHGRRSLPAHRQLRLPLDEQVREQRGGEVPQGPRNGYGSGAHHQRACLQQSLP